MVTISILSSPFSSISFLPLSLSLSPPRCHGQTTLRHLSLSLSVFVAKGGLRFLKLLARFFDFNYTVLTYFNKILRPPFPSIPPRVSTPVADGGPARFSLLLIPATSSPASPPPLLDALFEISRLLPPTVPSAVPPLTLWFVHLHPHRGRGWEQHLFPCRREPEIELEFHPLVRPPPPPFLPPPVFTTSSSRSRRGTGKPRSSRARDSIQSRRASNRKNIDRTVAFEKRGDGR